MERQAAAQRSVTTLGTDLPSSAADIEEPFGDLLLTQAGNPSQEESAVAQGKPSKPEIVSTGMPANMRAIRRKRAPSHSSTVAVQEATSPRSTTSRISTISRNKRLIGANKKAKVNPSNLDLFDGDW
eukprot:Protomagalhaensia_wolfi_Nauph_80__4781@NODE_4982_length_466_cov_1_679157_g4049_i0_p1_GENE_NODE_4982_length_466_cov_1_679157_g4049_i0NODE_4982_length_466_cov_1_679157_g4049_i0_p1_ORF_typecomplete_len127_score24_60_NODE_4982_length_466_cov_1_679157_g4049_i03383